METISSVEYAITFPFQFLSNHVPTPPVCQKCIRQESTHVSFEFYVHRVEFLLQELSTLNFPNIPIVVYVSTNFGRGKQTIGTQTTAVLQQEVLVLSIFG